MKKYLTFDFGGTTIKYAVMLDNLCMTARGKIETEVNDYEKFLCNLYEIIDQYYDAVEGICISLPGGVNSEKGEIYGAGAIYCLENKPLKRDLEERYHIPVAVENDANCAALAEFHAGVARGSRTMVFLVLGTGIGGSVIVDGKLLSTRNCFSGEFGYMVLDYEKMLTWEELNGSVISVVNEINKSGEFDECMDGKAVFDLYKKNIIVTEKLDQFYKMLACSCYTLQAIFDPDQIIIGGAISNREDLISNIEAFVDKVYDQRRIPQKPRIMVGAFRDSANLIGAYYNFLSKVKEKEM